MLAHSIRILTVTLVGALLAACGGGGGSSSGSSTTQPVQQTGTVTLALSDGVIEEYDQVLMDIEEIRFLSDGGQDILVLDESVLVDFLALQNFSEVLLRREVVAGTYSKIRLILNSLTLVKLDAEGRVLDEDVVQLNGLRKVDINPRGPFTVRGGEELLIDIDVDLDKSIHVVRAGNSGQIRFRPVIFASIISRTADQKLFRVEGTVESTDGGAAGTFTVCNIRRAFADGLNRPEPADVCVAVNPGDSTPYFDFEANPDSDGVAVNEQVVVYGKFSEESDVLVPAVVASGSLFETRMGLAASEFRSLTGDLLFGDFGASDDTCLVDSAPLRVQLANGAPAFIEYPGTADESAIADFNDLARLSLLCRRTEVEGYFVGAVAPTDEYLRAIILLLGPSQQGVVELMGTLSEKVDAAGDVAGDYVLDVADPATADPVVVVSDATRIVRITNVDPAVVVTEDVTRDALPDGSDTAEATTVYGVPRPDGVIDATFILLDETTPAGPV